MERYGRSRTGDLQQRSVTFGHRLLDGRYEITGGVPDGAQWSRNCAAGLRVGRAATIAKSTEPMNLAYRDIRHNLLRFVLTCVGLSLLLGIVIVITGVYRGLIDDALRQARAANADLWVVEAGTNGPFAESSRIPDDTREMVARVYGVDRAGAVTYQSVQTELNGKPLRFFLIGYELGRPGGPTQVGRRTRDYAQPLRNDRRSFRWSRARPGSAAGDTWAQFHRCRLDARQRH